MRARDGHRQKVYIIKIIIIILKKINMNLPLHNFLSEQMEIIKYSTWNLADISFLLSSSSFALRRLSSCTPQRLGSTQNNTLFSACHGGLVQHKTTHSSLHVTEAWFNTKQHSSPAHHRGLVQHKHTLSSCTPQGLGSTQNNTLSFWTALF